jgi:hypothetical protein
VRPVDLLLLGAMFLLAYAIGLLIVGVVLIVLAVVMQATGRRTWG